MVPVSPPVFHSTFELTFISSEVTGSIVTIRENCVREVGPETLCLYNPFVELAPTALISINTGCGVVHPTHGIIKLLVAGSATETNLPASIV